MDNVVEWYRDIPEPEKGQQVVEEVRYSKPRGRTDFFFLVLNFGFVIVLFILFGYCYCNGTIYRQIYGYDDCGNVCGIENPANEDQSCHSPDKRNHKILLFNQKNDNNEDKSYGHECVEKCPDSQDYVQIGTFCLPILDSVDMMNEIDFQAIDLKVDVIAIALSVAVAFAYIILVLLRYATKVVVWFVIGSFAALLVVLIILCFYLQLWFEAVMVIVIGLIYLLLFYRRKNNIKFVIKLFKESATSLMDMPLLLFEPLLTVLSLVIATSLSAYFMLVIDSAGSFNKEMYRFEKNGIITFAYWLNFFVFFWFVQFIAGCQHFVIAGTVSQWYFTRNKSTVRRPICNAFSNLVIFHLGTICLGSLLLTIIKIIRWIMRGIKRSMRGSNSGVVVALSYVYDFLLKLLEDVISFLSNNAYIVTAIDGLPFIAAGKRAVHLMFTNFGEKLAAELVGDIVVWTCKLFIFFMSCLIGCELLSTDQKMESDIFTFGIIVVLALLVSHIMMATFESAVDTLFICYSIDSEENDGVMRPYFMSESLKNAMNDAKQLAPSEEPEPQQV